VTTIEAMKNSSSIPASSNMLAINSQTNMDQLENNTMHFKKLSRQRQQFDDRLLVGNWFV
jgi:hypothetical protein